MADYFGVLPFAAFRIIAPPEARSGQSDFLYSFLAFFFFTAYNEKKNCFFCDGTP